MLKEALKIAMDALQVSANAGSICSDNSKTALLDIEEMEILSDRIDLYVGTKILEAKPMNLGDYNKLRGWTIPENEDSEKQGYCIYYPDNYCSWSPKDIFEQCYRVIDTKELELIKEVETRRKRGE